MEQDGYKELIAQDPADNSAGATAAAVIIEFDGLKAYSSYCMMRNSLPFMRRRDYEKGNDLTDERGICICYFDNGSCRPASG
jgi:hypothetical protein